MLDSDIIPLEHVNVLFYIKGMAKPKQQTLREFFQRFPDDDACLEHLMRTRYGKFHECQNCERRAHYYRVKARRCYECEHCGFQVYPMAGTPFEKTRTNLVDWFFIMHLFCASRNGVSAKEVERQIGVTYKTAWRMCRLIRTYMAEVDGDGPLGGKGRKPVEADKAFIGGKDEQGKDDKAIVLGMVERGGEIVTRVLPNRTKATVRTELVKVINPGARVMTDEGLPFSALGQLGYLQETVNHRSGEYVREDAHTNTIEGFWNLFKNSIRGTYVHVSQKYLDLYLGEFEYRWNLRKQPHLMFEFLAQGFAAPIRRTT